MAVRRTIRATLKSTLLLALLVVSVLAYGQTTTITGTVYDPRATNALPLPNVLVYATTGPVAPLPTGVQCLTYSAPSGAASYAYTAVDGTFILKNVPANTTYTLVIQAGKWRRQFSAKVGSAPLNALSLHMPSNHLEGDIPHIAIATGAYDGVECVLRDMGIADSEFTDDTGTVNPGGHIHLYQGSGKAGAYVSPATPLDTSLTGDAATLNSYDMVMFPCQGSPYSETDTAQGNLLNFANAGGRVFTTHFSYVWLDPSDYPNTSQFPPVANWHPEWTYPQPDPGIGTINTGFTDGATMAQWLKNAGATYGGQSDQIQISTLRHDIDSVIPPTQSWLTLNDLTDNNPIMQFTFNTPVGAPAANQCGRVLFNEYHVIDLNLTGTGPAFPAECPVGAGNAQEKMLEYALFDLSAFVQPIVVPTLSLAFNPSPLLVNANETAIPVTLTVANTSNNTAVDPSAALSLTLPAGLTATAINDAPGGGWNCALNTLKCTRTTSISSAVTDVITLTVSVNPYPLASYDGLLKATISSPTFSNDVVATDEVIFHQRTAPPLSVAPTPNPAFLSNPVSLKASIAWQTVAPTGTVTFYDGETQIGSSAVANGAASLSTSALTMGTHTISAIYSGDANYVSSTSQGIKQTIQDFSITVASGGGNAPAVNPGTPATFSLLVTPLGGATLPASLALTSEGLPPSSKVVFSPSTIAANSGPTTVAVVVTPPALALAKPAESRGKPLLPLALGLLVLPFARRLRAARRWVQILVLSLTAAAFGAAFTGCSSLNLTPRTFSLTVAATSGNLSHTTTINVSVK
ncbi:hypothetical protein DYQ86_10490 [Acidobacteria bacterium AB60]|nr:hypothetical protein DYQ86_10490 [Acidobacteria bacterium AB60]